MHAKLYCTQSAVTLGSSNFTEPGLHYQHEANVRFTESQEGRRFREVWQLAESFWAQGLDANQELIQLLEVAVTRREGAGQVRQDVWWQYEKPRWEKALHDWLTARFAPVALGRAAPF